MTRLPILALLLLTACKDNRPLAMPADSYEVRTRTPRRWTKPLAFGPHRAYPDESARRSWLADRGIVDREKAKQAHYLTVGDVTVECHSKVVVPPATLYASDRAETALLLCGYDRGGARWILDLRRVDAAQPSHAGSLHALDGGARYETRALNQAFEHGPLRDEPYGYSVGYDDGRPLVIVEAAEPGRVWIAPAAPNREILAAAAASLLQFRDWDVPRPKRDELDADVKRMLDEALRK